MTSRQSHGSASTVWLVGLLAAARIAVGAGTAKAPSIYDLGSEFSVSRNPNGPWEYGRSVTASLAHDGFALARVANTRGRIAFWQPEGGYYPYVASNPTRHTLADPTRSWAIRPHEVALEGSNEDQPAVVRFVVPRAGSYSVKARFAGIHFRLSSTDVHVLVNGLALFDALVEGYGGDPAFHAIEGRSPRATFVGTRHLAAGDVVTFAVGYGANRTHFNDTTGLRARLSGPRGARDLAR